MITHYGLMVFLYGFAAAVSIRISIQIAYALLKGNGNGYYISELRAFVISAILTVLIIINVLVVFFVANELYKLSQLSGITQ